MESGRSVCGHPYSKGGAKGMAGVGAGQAASGLLGNTKILAMSAQAIVDVLIERRTWRGIWLHQFEPHRHVATDADWCGASALRAPMRNVIQCGHALVLKCHCHGSLSSRQMPSARVPDRVDRASLEQHKSFYNLYVEKISVNTKS
jgi:hypothetical protein